MKKEDTKLISEFYELKVEQIMDRKIWDLPVIGKDEPISHVLSILDGKSHVWVVEDLKKKDLIGIITRHNVLYALSPPRRYYTFFSVPETCCHYGTKGVAEDIMKRDPITCKPDEKIVDVLQKMIRHQIRRLAVVKDEKIEGEITLKHLIHKYYRASQYYSITKQS